MNNNQELPLLTEVVEDTPARRFDELPVLLEIIPDEPPAQTKTVRTLNADEMHLLLDKLAVHLETVFTSKLNQQLEVMQRLAVDMAVSQFKAELPQLLHEALNKPDENS